MRIPIQKKRLKRLLIDTRHHTQKIPKVLSFQNNKLCYYFICKWSDRISWLSFSYGHNARILSFLSLSLWRKWSILRKTRILYKNYIVECETGTKTPFSVSSYEMFIQYYHHSVLLLGHVHCAMKICVAVKIERNEKQKKNYYEEEEWAQRTLRHIKTVHVGWFWYVSLTFFFLLLGFCFCSVINFFFPWIYLLVEILRLNIHPFEI